MSRGLQNWWFSSAQFSRSIVSDCLQPHEPQHVRPPCPSPIPGVHSDSCPLSRWCHPTISSSVVPFSSCPQSFPISGSFPMSQLFASGGQSIGVSAQHQWGGKNPAVGVSGVLSKCTSHLPSSSYNSKEKFENRNKNRVHLLTHFSLLRQVLRCSDLQVALLTWMPASPVCEISHNIQFCKHTGASHAFANVPNDRRWEVGTTNSSQSVLSFKRQNIYKTHRYIFKKT